MALNFAPFAGITRIRFKGFALARVSASRLPCVWIGAKHRVRCGRVKEPDSTMHVTLAAERMRTFLVVQFRETGIEAR